MGDASFQAWLRNVGAALRISLQLARDTYGSCVRVMRKCDAGVCCIASAADCPISPSAGPGIPLSSTGALYLVAEGWGDLSGCERARFTLFLHRLVHARREMPDGRRGGGKGRSSERA
jgi:hypothetical protein